MRRQKKRPFTLLEIMIVIFLIGLIGSVVGYNMKGSMDEGRAFKTKQAMEQIHDILMLEMAKRDKTADVIANNATAYLKLSGLVKDPNKLVKDGWGKTFDIKGDAEKGTITITSQAYENYKNKKKNIKINSGIPQKPKPSG